MRLITNEELLIVAGGSTVEGGDGGDVEEDGYDGFDSPDGAPKTKPRRADSSGGGSATVTTPTGSGTVECPFGTVPVISSSTTTTTGSGGGMLSFGTIATQGSASGQGSGSTTTSKTEATCIRGTSGKKQ